MKIESELTDLHGKVVAIRQVKRAQRRVLLWSVGVFITATCLLLKAYTIDVYVLEHALHRFNPLLPHYAIASTPLYKTLWAFPFWSRLDAVCWLVAGILGGVSTVCIQKYPRITFYCLFAAQFIGAVCLPQLIKIVRIVPESSLRFVPNLFFLLTGCFLVIYLWRYGRRQGSRVD